MLFPFLINVPVTRLSRIAERVFKFEIANPEDREAVERALFSVFGFDVLSEQSIRHLLFEHLDESEIEQLCSSFRLQSGLSVYDTAAVLSTMTWSANSKLVAEVSRLLRLDSMFLPRSRSLEAQSDEFSPRVKLKPMLDYQSDVVARLITLLLSDESVDRRALMQLPTGAGKTRTCMEALANFLVNRKDNQVPAGVLWLSHSEELLEQSVGALRGVWSNKGSYPLKVQRFWSSYNLVFDNLVDSFVFASFQKLVRFGLRIEEEAFESFSRSFAVVVVDEAHKINAPKISEIVEKVLSLNSDCKLLGLTATPGRSASMDHENRRLVKMFGGKLITSDLLGSNPIQYLQERKILSKVVHMDLLSPTEVKATRHHDAIDDLAPSILSRLALDEERNELIVGVAKREASILGGRVLIFCCTSQHSERIAAYLALAGVPSASITHTTKRSTRTSMISLFREGKIKCLCNYGVLTTGFDDPEITCVLIARPTSSLVLYSQMLGRGLRGEAMGGRDSCKVIDVKDNFGEYGDIDFVYSYFDGYWNGE